MIVQTIPSPLPVQHGLSHLLSQPGSPYLIHLSVPVNLVLAHCHQPGPAPMLALSGSSARPDCGYSPRNKHLMEFLNDPLSDSSELFSWVALEVVAVKPRSPY